MKLVKYNDPILTEPIEEYNVLNTDTAKIAWELGQAMVEYGGIGLAANQVGLKVRAFAIATNPIKVMFNPVIVDYSDETVTLEESCLSYPGLVVKVTRPIHVRVRYTLPNNDTLTEKFTGMTARIIQHEIEHLEGKRFFDVVDWYEKEKTLRWFKKMKRETYG